MVNRGDCDPRLLGWVSGRRVAAGLALAAVIIAGCGNTDVNVSADDLLPESRDARVEQEADPELQDHIDEIALSTAEMTMRLADGGVDLKRYAPEPHFYTVAPGSVYSASLRLEEGATEVNPETLARLHIVKYPADDSQSIESIDFTRGLDGDLSIQAWIGGGDYFFDGYGDASQLDAFTSELGLFLAELETAAA